jgi:F-type H+-transporting ATPase subunit a
MHHEVPVILPLSLGGLDLSITAQVFWTFIASACVIFFGLWARRKMTQVPDRMLQHLFEITIDFIERHILEPNGLEFRRWTSLFLSIFLFVFLNSLVAIIPGASSGSSNINQTMALALIFFGLALVLRFRQHGPFGFFKSLVPSGIGGTMRALLFPIELVSLFIKPFSLALRLFANIFAGHTLFVTIIAFAATAHNFVVPFLAVGGGIIIILFKLFVCFIQAYIFAFLSALMIAEAREEH